MTQTDQNNIFGFNIIDFFEHILLCKFSENNTPILQGFKKKKKSSTKRKV